MKRSTSHSQLEILNFFKSKSKIAIVNCDNESDTQDGPSEKVSKLVDGNEENGVITTTKVETVSSTKSFPDVWTAEQWQERRIKHPWLESRNGKLSCLICSNVKFLSSAKSQGLYLSPEWSNFSVTYSGNTREKQLKTLRTKIILHQKSDGHKKAQDIINLNKKCTIEKLIDSQVQHSQEATIKVFNTAYYLAKHNRPYSDHIDLIQLQQKNGLDLGISLHSRATSTAIIDHVADEFKKKLGQHWKESGTKVSVIIDESTSLSNKSVLIVYLRTVLDYQDTTIFLDILELNDQKALTITNSLLNCLASYSMSEDYLKKHLLCFASDGASVMLGVKAGVAKQLEEKFPAIIIWHCLNHRLELAISDALRDQNSFNHFQSFIEDIYSLYNQSPKNCRELTNVSSELGLQINKIGKILGVRWVASSYRAVSAVWRAYPALVQHFRESSTDKNRSTTERSKYSGLLNRMQSNEFLEDLALICDVLVELSFLSLQLQDRQCNISRADKLIHRTILVIDSMKTKEVPGEHTKIAEEGVSKKSFKDVDLMPNKRLTPINKEQFLTSIIDNLKRRCFTTQSSNLKQKVCAAEDDNKDKYSQLLHDIDKLNPDFWPNDVQLLYGRDSVTRLCRRFKLENEKSILNGFQDYLDIGGRKIPSALQPLVDCVTALPCSSAEAERGFSCMNSIITPTRNRLLIKHLSSIMFIQLNGPPLEKWNAQPYVKLWLRKHHSAIETKSRHVTAAKDVDASKEKLWSLF